MLVTVASSACAVFGSSEVSLTLPVIACATLDIPPLSTAD